MPADAKVKGTNVLPYSETIVVRQEEPVPVLGWRQHHNECNTEHVLDCNSDTVPVASPGVIESDSAPPSWYFAAELVPNLHKNWVYHSGSSGPQDAFMLPFLEAYSMYIELKLQDAEPLTSRQIGFHRMFDKHARLVTRRGTHAIEVDIAILNGMALLLRLHATPVGQSGDSIDTTKFTDVQELHTGLSFAMLVD
ncbi:hypothetical protein HGRIS_008945 [Hohenbuehelia grisea]|uniref:Uncharacterized protein n=1 Tax=Hohenbuehelia grisea TaxID=104357 RepID=A0ABR3J117_9AGAR